MTDTEIIKALECCKENTRCMECPMWGKGQNCMNNLYRYALALINRQQAEIEKMKQDLTIDLEGFESEYDEKIKSEARKEFAEQLEAEIISSDKYIREYDGSEVQKAYNKGLRDALKILKEMG